MTEQTKSRKRIPAAFVALAACAALIGSAGAANAATDGELFQVLSDYIQVNVFKSVAVSPEGNEYTIMDATAEIVEVNGRTVLVTPAEEVDITDALNNDGEYHYERTDGGTTCTVDVTGTPEQWTMTSAVYDEGEEPTYFTRTSEGGGVSITLADGDLLEGGEEITFSYRGDSDGDDVHSGTFVINEP